MAKILVLGNVNLETTVAIDAFPLEYQPVRYLSGGVRSTVSAVGYNVARALTTLGNDVRLLSIVGQDVAAEQIRHTLRRDGISDEHVLGLVDETPQSVVLYDEQGRRQVFTDLKNVLSQDYPAETFAKALEECDALILTNISYSKSVLPIAQASGKLIVTDVQTVAHLDDDYNQPFLQAANILFLSGERLSDPPKIWLRKLFSQFNTAMAVVGLGAEGAALGLSTDKSVKTISTVPNEKVVSTGGAGDALCAAFVHSYLRGDDAEMALEKAVVFASHTVGFASSSKGFVDHATLQRLYQDTWFAVTDTQ